MRNEECGVRNAESQPEPLRTPHLLANHLSTLLVSVYS